MSEEAKIAGAPVAHEAPAPPAPEPPKTDTAPPPSPPVMLEPLPVQASPPSPPAPAQQTADQPGRLGAPSTAPAPEPPKQKPEPDKHLAAMREELEQAKRVRAELQEMRDRSLAATRLAYLRRAGATAALTDENLMALAPVVDVETDEGKAAIEAWRQANAGLFAAPQLSGKQRTASMVEGLKSSKNGVFGPRLHARVAASALEE